MNTDKAFEMFMEKSDEMEKIGGYDSVDVIVEMAMMLGYDYAINVKEVTE